MYDIYISYITLLLVTRKLQETIHSPAGREKNKMK